MGVYVYVLSSVQFGRLFQTDGDRCYTVSMWQSTLRNCYTMPVWEQNVLSQKIFSTWWCIAVQPITVYTVSKVILIGNAKGQYPRLHTSQTNNALLALKTLRETYVQREYTKCNGPNAWSVEFRLRALASSVAPTWLIWLLRRSNVDSELLPPTPSQNTENAFSISPKSFHSSVKLEKHIWLSQYDC